MNEPLADSTALRSLFHQNLTATFMNYLKFYPAEKERLSHLQDCLKNTNLDLRLRSTIPEGHMCASGIILLPGDKILMLRHKALSMWVVPGGHYDISDIDLATTAIREASEESGIDNITLHPWHLKSGIPLDIDIHPIPQNDKKNEGAHQHMDFRYILEIENAAEIVDKLKLQDSEVLGYKLMDIASVDPGSSIAPALKKLYLLS